MSLSDPLIRSLLLILAASVAIGCASTRPVTLMPTPVLYEDRIVEPFSHVAEALRTPTTQVFYATNRAHRAHDPEQPYGNGFDDELHLGAASVRIGAPDVDWDEIVEMSLDNPPGSTIPITLDDVTHWDSLLHRASGSVVDWDEASHSRFVSEINAELDHHVDREIMVYVHGTKTGFEPAIAMAGEIDHFAGKDFVGVAFAWPSHQNILYYLLRIDVRRAQHSSEALRDLIKLLATETTARRINILSWSAGGRVTSKALHELRRERPDLDRHEARDLYRLGSVVFAAADVELDDFLERLPAISELADQVVLTLTDDDVALNAARKYMRGQVRIGTLEAEQAELEFIDSHHLENVEIIDVSHGKDARGFDITGHHYWYRHPWNASDIILLMRTDLGPAERGLSAAETYGLWYLSPDYPDRVRAAAQSVLADDWADGGRINN
jgi:esterase/lipase superfamily enzyme